MRHYLFTYIGIILAIASLGGKELLAQGGPEVIWGRESNTHHRIMDVIGPIDSSYYLLRGVPGIMGYSTYSGVNIQRLDAQLNPQPATPFRMFHEGQELDVEKAIRYRSDIYVFGSRRNYGRRAKELYGTRVDLNTLQAAIDPVLVATLPLLNRSVDGEFAYKFSRDSSRFCIFSRAGASRRDPRHLGFHVFDDGFNLQWSESVTLPYLEQQFEVTDFVVDREGNTYILGKLYPTDRRMSLRSRQRFEYRVIAFREDGQESEEYVINVKNRYLSDIHLEIAPDGNLICAGFYSERNNLSARGTFYLTINATTKEVLTSSFYDFSVDFLTLNLTDGQERRKRRKVAKGKNVELYQYDIRDLVPRGDGGVVLTAEQFFVQTVSTTDPRTSVPITRILYHFNTILVVSISPEGQIEWATKIPKFQKATQDQASFASYALMITDAHLYFIYNDHRKNIDEQRVNRLRNFSLDDRNGVVAMASVDPEGKVERKKLLPQKEIETLTQPRLCTQISPNEMMMIARYRKNVQYGRVDFKEAGKE